MITNTFIGNGTDAYVDLSDSFTNNYKGLSMSVNVKITQVGNDVDIIGITRTNGDGLLYLSILADGTFLLLALRGVNTAAVTFASVPQQIAVGDEFNISFHYDNTNNGPESVLFYINGVRPQVRGSTLSYHNCNSFNPNKDEAVTLYLNADKMYVGRATNNAFISQYYADIEVYDVYWSNNINAIDEATIIQYADGEEHFTQQAPDVLVDDWFGGAVQGSLIGTNIATNATYIDISHLNAFVGFNPVKNDRLINLIKYLPDNFSGTQLSEFILFFENFLNYELFDHKIDPNLPDKKISILKKIELLSTLRDPNLIDADLLQFFASYLGYDINYNRADIFTTSTVTETNNYLRETISSLPSWYKLKSTSSSLSMLMYMFGIVSEVYTIWTNDYENNWDKENPTYESDKINVNLPAGYYPTPHFNVTINNDSTQGDYLSNLSTIIPMIESIKPINAVFEGFRLSTVLDSQNINNHVSPVVISRIDTIENFI